MAIDLGDGAIVKVAPPPLPTVTTAPPGPENVRVLPVAGPPGPAGGSNFRFDQAIPAAVWTIEHNLGRRPVSVALFSDDFAQEYGEFAVQHLDLNSLRISMETPTAGVALLG